MSASAGDLTLRRTRRMALRRPAASDLADLCRMERDARTMATVLGVRSREQTAAALERMVAHWDPHGFGWWICRRGDTGEFLGRGGLRRVVVEGRGEIEVGYGFRAAFWGQGFATELAEASLSVGFQYLDFNSIVSFTLPGNAASRRVMEKAGLRRERDGTWAGRPHVFYRLQRAEWSARRATSQAGDGILRPDASHAQGKDT